MATAGKGCYLLRWSGSDWAEVAEVNSINGPTATRDTIETTHLRSAGNYRQFIASWKDGGEMTFQCNFTRDTYEELKADFESDNLNDWQLVISDAAATTFSFEALLTGLPIDVPFDDKITVDVTLKISGAVTIDSGPSSASPS